MKKTIALICALMLAFTLFACTSVATPGKVTIIYVDEGSDVIRLLSTDKADYGFIAEPAATNALKNPNVLANIQNKTIDIQGEWKALTGLDGYPQASLFVKDGLDFSVVDEFLALSKEAGKWAAENPIAAVAAIKANAFAGTESTMPSINDGSIVRRCNITSQTEGIKEYIESFLTKVGSAFPKDNGIYYQSGTSGDAKQILNVYMPDGATALALAFMMEHHLQINDVQIKYHVVPPKDIASTIIKGDADLALLPTNAAITLYNTGSVKYKLASVMTHGNLFIIGTDNLADLEGKSLVAIGQGNIPALVLNYVLSENNIKTVVIE